MNKLAITLTCAALCASIDAAPASALSNPLVVDLHRANSSQRDASATLFGSDTGVLVNVTANAGIPNNAAISLNEGTCPKPGEVAFALSGMNGGASLTQLKHPLSDVADRAKSLVIHQTSDLNSAPYACGNISE